MQGGALFRAQSLRVILTNSSIAGNPVFRGQAGDPIVNEGGYPAILNAQEWATLQERLAIRSEGQHRGNMGHSAYLLTGILRCAHCGGAMAGGEH